RRRVAAPGVDEQVRLWADGHTVVAGGGREPFDAAAVEANSVEIQPEMAVACAGDVGPARLLIDAVQCARLPRPAGQLAPNLAGAVEAVPVLPAAALAGQQERAVLEEGRLAGVFDPAVGLVAQQPRGRAALVRGKADVQPG